MQIATWILLPLLLLQYLFFLSPVLPLGASIPLSIIFVVFGLLSVYYGYKVTIIDPIDERLQCHLDRQANGGNNGPRQHSPNLAHQNGLKICGSMSCLSASKEGDASPPSLSFQPAENEESITKFCWVCQTRVHEKSMHCKFCDKCVDHFDHHCQWLNTCVGKRNYMYFFRTVCCLAGFLSVQSVSSVAIVIAYFVQLNEWETKGTKGGTYDRMSSVYGGNNETGLIVVIIVFMVAVTLFLGLVGQLLVFHIGLQREGISTYEYIVRDNQKKREKSNEKRDKKARRNQAIEEEKRKGNLAICLMLGEYCTLCDPLKEEDEEVGQFLEMKRMGGSYDKAMENGNGAAVEPATFADPTQDLKPESENEEISERDVLKELPGVVISMSDDNGDGFVECATPTKDTSDDGETEKSALEQAISSSSTSKRENENSQPQHKIEFLSVSKDLNSPRKSFHSIAGEVSQEEKHEIGNESVTKVEDGKTFSDDTLKTTESRVSIQALDVTASPEEIQNKTQSPAKVDVERHTANGPQEGAADVGAASQIDQVAPPPPALSPNKMEIRTTPNAAATNGDFMPSPVRELSILSEMEQHSPDKAAGTPPALR